MVAQTTARWSSQQSASRFLSSCLECLGEVSRIGNRGQTSATEPHSGNDIRRAEVCAGCRDCIEHDPTARVQTAGGGGTYGAHLSHRTQCCQSPWWRHRCGELGTQGQPDLPPRSGKHYGYLSDALMVLTLVTEHNVASHLGGVIAVENLVHKANQIFLQDQMKINGDATLCCAKPKEARETTSSGGLLCGGAAYICQHFYDSAPSGSFGTMTYIMRATATLLDCLPKEGDIDCNVQ
uniref:Phosphorylase b kinase regulatory subunit n=1 Tax=Homalodisca liturata TaxID=320908 RepID=A0A1B6HMQ7_9HEMI